LSLVGLEFMLNQVEDVKTYNLVEEYEGVKIEYVSVGELKALKD